MVHTFIIMKKRGGWSTEQEIFDKHLEFSGKYFEFIGK